MGERNRERHPLIEHARWLSGADIERILDPALERFAYLIETAPHTPAEIATATLRMQGHDVIRSSTSSTASVASSSTAGSLSTRSPRRRSRVAKRKHGRR